MDLLAECSLLQKSSEDTIRILFPSDPDPLFTDANRCGKGRSWTLHFLLSETEEVIIHVFDHVLVTTRPT